MGREQALKLTELLARPLRRFLAIEAASSILLVAATLIALAAANSPWREGWAHFWHQRVALEIGSFELALSLGHWVNDGLMAVFFFVVGLEIKRELTIGELASREKRACPPEMRSGEASVMGTCTRPGELWAGQDMLQGRPPTVWKA
jgi:Na+/H+ antiporter NhaA